MNVTAHQEKKKNEETKTGMKKTGEGKRHATDFREAVCCPTAVVQGAARRKNSLRGVPRLLRPSGRPVVISTQSITGLGTAPPL